MSYLLKQTSLFPVTATINQSDYPHLSKLRRQLQGKLIPFEIDVVISSRTEFVFKFFNMHSPVFGGRAECIGVAGSSVSTLTKEAKAEFDSILGEAAFAVVGQLQKTLVKYRAKYESLIEDHKKFISVFPNHPPIESYKRARDRYNQAIGDAQDSLTSLSHEYLNFPPLSSGPEVFNPKL